MTTALKTGHRRTPALDVAVVGGGMVGAAAALALSRAGFSTALLEARAPTPWSADDDVDLRVVGLAPSSIALLDDLGVWPSIRDARASSYSHMHVWDAENGARSTSMPPMKAAIHLAISLKTTLCNGHCGNRWKRPVSTGFALQR
jgi:2-octaprenylphenol hydroxylase